jgi:hypothetical protein
MNKPKFTPGPWHVGALAEEVITSKGRAIASRPEDNQDEEEWEANAALIATAPDLYERGTELAQAVLDISWPAGMYQWEHAIKLARAFLDAAEPRKDK